MQYDLKVMQSSQDFVKGLKSTADPPFPGGPLKLNIATDAWNDTSFYIPRKGQVIAEWILSKFQKDRANDMFAY
jgi:hypothetical protein